MDRKYDVMTLILASYNYANVPKYGPLRHKVDVYNSYTAFYIITQLPIGTSHVTHPP